MSKQWYYEIMGAPLGPISSAELKHKVQHGEIQIDTRVRLGADGKWLTADRIKGLMDAPVPTTPAERPAPAPATAPGPTDATDLRQCEESINPISADAGNDALASSEPPVEYDFFRFVGFENALGAQLHQVLCDYCRTHRLTITQATRRAIAALVQRQDLADDKPAAAAQTI